MTWRGEEEGGRRGGRGRGKGGEQERDGRERGGGREKQKFCAVNHIYLQSTGIYHV